MKSATILILLVVGTLQLFGAAFVVHPVNLMAGRLAKQNIRPARIVFMAEGSEEDRLSSLGYSEDEIRRSRQEPSKEPPSVRVDLVPDVDAATLTAVGFGLIAFNFFVLANMGDGGIGGVVATIINTVNQ